MADRFASRRYSIKKTKTNKQTNKLGDRKIKQLLNLVIAKYRCQCLADQYLLATGKSRYFAQPRPIIVNCWRYGRGIFRNAEWPPNAQ